MAVNVVCIQTRSVSESLYLVDVSISTSSGIVPQIFVKREQTYEYDHVASVSEMSSLSTTPAITDGYYRDDKFIRSFSDVETANAFSLGLSTRIQSLMSAYDVAVNVFLGSTTQVISS
jgi:hypothetical protein